MVELSAETRERLAVIYDEFRRLIPSCLVGSDSHIDRSFVVHIAANRYVRVGQRLLFRERPLCGSRGAPFFLISDPEGHRFRIVCRRCARIACKLTQQVNEGKETVGVGN